VSKVTKTLDGFSVANADANPPFGDSVRSAECTWVLPSGTPRRSPHFHREGVEEILNLTRGGEASPYSQAGWAVLTRIGSRSTRVEEPATGTGFRASQRIRGKREEGDSE